MLSNWGKLGESRFSLGIDPLLAFVDKDGAVKTTTKDPQDTAYPQIMTVCHDMVNYPNLREMNNNQWGHKFVRW